MRKHFVNSSYLTFSFKKSTCLLVISYFIGISKCWNFTESSTNSTNILSNKEATVSPEQENTQEISRHEWNGDAFVPVTRPRDSVFQNSYPRLKLTNTSKELYTNDEPLNTRVVPKFRVARAYPIGMPSRYHRINRFDHRNGDQDYGSSNWGGKWFNKLKRRTNMIMNPATDYDSMPSSYHSQSQGGTQEEPDMAATYGGGGGHGGGHGGGGYGKGVNKSAVGLLGFLSLLSLIQNVLNQTANGRRRRDVRTGDIVDFDFDDMGNDWDESVTETALVVPVLLPMLNAVSHAQNGALPVECTLQPVCVANHILMEKLSGRGKIVGTKLTTAIAKTLKRQRPSGNMDYSGDICGRIIRAGMSGRSGKVCQQLYKGCPQLSRLPQVPQYFARMLLTQEDE